MSARIAFIGCGPIARAHAPAVELAGARVCAFSARSESPNATAFRTLVPDASFYTDWRSMISRERPDALFVLASWSAIPELAPEVLAYGLPTFFEKPVALSLPQAQRTRAAWSGDPRRVLVGYNRRFYPFMAELREHFLRQPLWSVEAAVPEIVDKYRGRPDELAILGNLLHYSSAHALDLLHFLLGPLSVEQVIRSAPPASAAAAPAGSYAALLTTSARVPVQLTISLGASRNTQLVLNFEGTTVVLSPLERMSIQKGMGRVPDRPGSSGNAYQPIVQGLREAAGGPVRPGFAEQAEYFVRHCVEGAPGEPVGATLEDVVALASLIDGLTAR